MRNKVIETQRTLIKAAAAYNTFGVVGEPYQYAKGNEFEFKSNEDRQTSKELRFDLEVARIEHQMAIRTYRAEV